MPSLICIDAPYFVETIHELSLQNNNPKFKNKYRTTSHRLQNYDYSSDGAYFITICCKNREHSFGQIINGKLEETKPSQMFLKHWYNIPYHYKNCVLDEIIVMPNHIHGIIFLQNSIETIPELSLYDLQNPKQRRKMTFPKIMGRLKMQTAKDINEYRSTQGQPFWQRNYYDRIIRNEDELNRIREYIIRNPEKWNEDQNNIENIFI